MLFLAFVIAFPCVGWISAMSFKHKERMAELQQGSAPGDPSIMERLDRIEQSVEAIAVEVERIGEGQRFLTGLAAERSLPGGSTRGATQ